MTLYYNCVFFPALQKCGLFEDILYSHHPTLKPARELALTIE